MKLRLHPDIIEATRLTREGRIAEATALLQRVAGSHAPAETTPTPPHDAAHAPSGRASRLFDVAPDTGQATPREPPRSTGGTGGTDRFARRGGGTPPPGARVSLHDLVARLRELHGQRHAPVRDDQALPDGARFLTGSFSGEAGRRAYRLYIPGSHRGGPAPLLVMLHGCTQSPEDFAAGTRMNSLAEEHGWLVAYPAQPHSANPQKCWNWFNPEDQLRDRGEPSLVAGITRQVMREQDVDPRRVYVAGLSAGGAAAAIMAATHPDLYAAAGVHSGMPCGAAKDLPSALTAMRQGAALPPRPNQPMVPTIVFHGDEDRMVHPRNGEAVIAQSAARAGADLRTERLRGQVPGGHTFSRVLHSKGDGQTMLEHWVVHGGGHAWFGGSDAGSYTDPRGPDASGEMLRFFRQHVGAPGQPS
ncbi:PHB depolymerase family esterase [Rhodovastum atsumiense]|uniref:PHB depolymerase family esterase n=1 Tax=Rhodovastum atsumiense TaxID=504468 RepID=A0A5M6ILU6_9PROT|nr:PHB depolymerase family esterase [Rhodovastum atsumiense]KAA5609250.1 PHB depolymerase family esterase [Rhodovastum atsumiense]CAH2601702.1 PHB depolymerase family esterase [Rhodovastum atsumiense]